MRQAALRVFTLTAVMCVLVLGEQTAAAGQDTESAPIPPPANSIILPVGFDGPPPPLAPEVISRDSSGRATIRAVRLTSPLQLDGRLDEAIFSSVLPISGFIQNDPEEGAPATERTEIWILYDDDNVYVVARCWESAPERRVATEMRRDNTNIVQNDNIGFSFDTFYDRRNAIIFEVNPLGGRIDGQVTNERQINPDWNPIWELEVGEFEGGWAFEAALPFESLRYRPGRAQIWGFQARRHNKWKNEVSYVTRIPASLQRRGHFQASLAATLIGLEAPPASNNLEIKPYLTSALTSDLTATPEISNDLGMDVGLDAKYSVTTNLTADFTVNTDFAQVEADEQQVNLTRFSLLFPEKREFFLENQGTFSFGGVNVGRASAANDTPLLFYSRRIGLDQGRAIPIDAGARLTGRIGRYSLGLMNIQAGDEPIADVRPTNFSVVRLKRDLLRRSAVGLLFTRRSVGASGTGTNEAYGLDGSFAFYDNLVINTYWAQTHTDGLSGENASYRAQLDYAGDRYGIQLERLAVGDDFNPEVGFVRRDDIRKNFGLFRFSPRPRSNRLIRRLLWTASLDYIENGAGRLEGREQNGEFAIEFHSGDRFDVGIRDSYEFIPEPFEIASNVTVPTGGYNFVNARTSFTFGQQRSMSGIVAAEFGTLYNGNRFSMSVSRGQFSIAPHWSIEPRVSLDWVDLEQGSFTSRLIGSRVTYTMTPRMFVGALIQYNSDRNLMTANARLRWEYQPGSELFVVYNDERDTLSPGFPIATNRSFIVKVNRLFRF